MAETSLARRLASPEVLCNLDRKLTVTVTHMGWALVRTEEVAMLDAVLVTFDLDALQSQATRTMKKKCIGVHLLTAGGYNIVFLLLFDDRTDVLARLRMPGNGREGHNPAIPVSEQELAERFSSEVATLRFLKTRTSIPVPELYYWDADAANPVGTRYMLMQRFSAELLIHVFNDMTPAGREKVVTQIAKFEAELYDNSLGAIGVLIDGNGTVGPLGPSCTGVHVLPDNRGPFTSSKQLLLACVDNELDLITRRPAEWTNGRIRSSNVNGGVEALSADYAAQLFQLLKSAIGRLPDELSFSPPVFRLAHTDFNDGNILVVSAEDPTIVAVIDWEGARVVPAWDARVGCDLSWLHCAIGSVEEGEALQKIYNDITTADGRSLGTSALCLQDLLSLLEGRPTRRLDRKRLNNELLAWLTSAESSGQKCCSLELEGFRSLKEFIENGLMGVFCGKVNGGVEALPADYAAQLLKLLKSAIGRLPDELSFSPPVFRLAHTDFNDGNILVVSAEDPTIVAVIDWEGARVVPAWDARVGCDLSWLHCAIGSFEEGKALQKISNDITTADGRSLGTSALCLQDLLSLLEGRPARRLDRKRLNNESLAWLASAESSGHKCCSLDLPSESPLCWALPGSAQICPPKKHQ
ncbi:hypothetical protein C8R44DRAFT_895066 [Mycena epipterygia]|nr:hypothetical protein C8R44DRAFT_895066 [Mycena epipterygia]